MVKMLKVSGILIAVIILLLLIAVGALFTLVNPDKIKPVIIAQVSKYTGRQLVIDGDLSWTFYPTLAIKINHAALSSPAQFNQVNFAEIKHATVGVKLMPLLHSSIEFTNITLSGLKLNLITNPDGTTNWQNMQAPKPADASASIATSADRKTHYAIQISAIDVTDADITLNDLQAKQYTQISKFEFHAKNISPSQSFPLTSSFDLLTKASAAALHITLDGTINLDPDKEIYTLKQLDFTVTTRQNNKDIVLNVAGDVIANLAEQTLLVKNWVSHLGNLTLNGNVHVTKLLTEPEVSGHLDAPAFDLKALLLSLGQAAPSLQSAKNVSANLDFSTTPKSVSMLQSLNVQGQIKVPELQAAKLIATQVNINAEMKNGLLNFSSITAAFYQGSLKSQAKINLTAATPQITFQSTLAGVQAEPLLTDLQSQPGKLKVKGAGNIDIEATSSGIDANTITHNLNGTITFSFKDGVLDGVNLGYMIDTANAFLHGQAPPAQGQNLTNFGNLTGTAVIKNGVITNNDLTVISPRFDSNGQGTINLVSEQIRYSLQVKAKVPGNDMLNNLTLPVNISGSLNDPSVKLDVGSLAQYLAKQKIQQVQDKVSEQIKSKVSGQAGALLQNLLGK